MGSVCTLALTERKASFSTLPFFSGRKQNVHEPSLHAHSTSIVVVALVHWEQCLLAANRALNSSLCFLLPSHSDNRASHDLLPIFFLLWLLFLHCMSFKRHLPVTEHHSDCDNVVSLFSFGTRDRKGAGAFAA